MTINIEITGEVEAHTTSPLEVLLNAHRAEVETLAARHDLDPRVSNALITFAVALGAYAFAFGPSIIDGMATQGLEFLEANVYALASAFTAFTWTPIEAETARNTVKALSLGDLLGALNAWKPEVHKLATEWRAYVNVLLGLGVIISTAKKILDLKPIREGRAPIDRKRRTSKKPQTFVVGGRGSRIAEAQMLGEPENTVPIFDNQAGGVALSAEYAPEGESRLERILAVFLARASFVSLDLGDHTNSLRGLEAWRRIKVGKKNLLSTSGGRPVALVIGCAENPEEELAHFSEIPDVTIEELLTAGEMIAERFEAGGVSRNDFDIVTVNIGSADTPRRDALTGELTTTDRKSAEEAGVSIYLDSWKAVLWGLRSELVRLKVADQGIVLVSTVPEYRELFQQVASEIGIVIYDAYAIPIGMKPTYVVYERQTDETLNAVRRWKTKVSEGQQVIALTSDIRTHRVAAKEGLNSVCSADIVTNFLKSIRILLQQGKSSQEIQALLDATLATKKHNPAKTHDHSSKAPGLESTPVTHGV